MAQLVVDYRFASDSDIRNPDGSLPVQVSNVIEVTGPGATSLGQLDRALHFVPGSLLQTTISPGTLDPARFCVRAAIRVTEDVTTRFNLVESTSRPFALFLEPGSESTAFNVVAAVQNGRVDWTVAHTTNRVSLQLNTWYVLSLVYDLNTLAVMVDDKVVGVCAFPDGGLSGGTGDKLYIGTWVDGSRWPFKGDIAAVQIYRDIPPEQENVVDAQQSLPEWFLTHKHNEIRPSLFFGQKTADFYFDGAIGSWVQPFQDGWIAYTEGHGTAFETHGAIYALYLNDSSLQPALGPLVSDEINGRLGGSRKSVFAKGCIYWSPQTRPVPVLDRMYLDYELLNEGESAIGLPLQPMLPITDGHTQQFQFGEMFHRNGASNAFEVHGAILGQFKATGGVSRWGYPVSHESDVMNQENVTIGKVSHFETCSIYWSSRTGAHIIYGAIRGAYHDVGGPRGHLGFPTSSEADISGVRDGARYNTFEHGSILWFNEQTHICDPFSFRIGWVDTKEEDRDILDPDGQNDLYLRISIELNGHRVYDKKLPEGRGHYPSNNIIEVKYNVPYEVVPNDPNLRVTLRLEIWESDDGNLFGGGDDLLGTLVKELTISNAWGWFESSDGLFKSSNFGPWVNFVTWSIQPKRGVSTPLDNWGVGNQSTDRVDEREYAAAFSDVDPDREIDFGIIDDALKALFYKLFVKDIASNGNCFGMSTEAIYAYNDMSRLSLPLRRFSDWHRVEDDFNVRQCYQLGADPIWWFVGQFLRGNTHSPINVFQETWDCYNRGSHPVICLAQNYNFSGAPHAILPIGWRRDVPPWEIACFDPKRQQEKSSIFIDPNQNTFRCDSNGTIYEGSEWSGGRLHYMPFSVLNHRQRTPVWDAILLLLSGVIVILGDDAKTESITDKNGTELDATKLNSHRIEDFQGKFIPFPGIAGEGPLKGELYLKSDMHAGPAGGSVDLDGLHHIVMGKRDGVFTYYVKRPLLGLQLEGPITANEQVTISMSSLQVVDNEVTIAAQHAAPYSLQLVSKLGAGSDYLKVHLENLPIEPGRDMKLNVPPNLQSIDILTTGTPADVRLTLEGIINKVPVQKGFRFRLDKGARLTIPNASTNLGQLKVGAIDSLKGSIRDTRMISAH